jgi:flagellar basal-body rod modification protein FlgD
MPIAGINDNTGPVVGAVARDYSQVSKVDFMNLLVAQIQNQDPLSPMDNQEFTSQITQFTMLEEMEKTNANLEENLIVGQAINNTAMLGLVGKNVTVEGNKLALTDGVASENMIAVDAPSTAVIEVTDRAGKVVATYERDLDAGLNDVTWDGLLDDGTVAADGDYSLTVTVRNSADVELDSFATLMTAPVAGLRYEDNQAIVMVAGLEYHVSEIYKVS